MLGFMLGFLLLVLRHSLWEADIALHSEGSLFCRFVVCCCTYMLLNTWRPNGGSLDTIATTMIPGTSARQIRLPTLDAFFLLAELVSMLEYVYHLKPIGRSTSPSVYIVKS